MTIATRLNHRWTRLNYLKKRGNLSTDDQLLMLLNIGVDVLDMDVGFINGVIGNQCQVEFCTDHRYIHQVWNLSDTFCDLTMHYRDVVDLERIPPDLQRHTAYRVQPIASYIGVPFTVNGYVHGTVAFLKPEPRVDEFTHMTADFMWMLSHHVTRIYEGRMC